MGYYIEIYTDWMGTENILPPKQVIEESQQSSICVKSSMEKYMTKPRSMLYTASVYFASISKNKFYLFILF